MLFETCGHACKARAHHDLRSITKTCTAGQKVKKQSDDENVHEHIVCSIIRHGAIQYVVQFGYAKVDTMVGYAKVDTMVGYAKVDLVH